MREQMIFEEQKIEVEINMDFDNIYSALDVLDEDHTLQAERAQAEEWAEAYGLESFKVHGCSEQGYGVLIGKRSNIQAFLCDMYGYSDEDLDWVGAL